MASLRELQHSFAAALKDPGTPCAVRPLANLDVYRHNAEHQFRNALGISFPVLRRRVGDDYFNQLAFHYRARFPSRSGDLQWVGREFPAFLGSHLQGGDYAWLADLATLEWARELAAIGEVCPALGAEALSRFAPEDLGRLVFRLQPTLQLVHSMFPVHSVWLANQQANAAPVDQSLGAEHVMILCRNDGLRMRVLSPALHTYLAAINAGAPLADAMATAELDEAGLLHALQTTFSEGLVCGLSLAGPAD